MKIYRNEIINGKEEELEIEKIILNFFLMMTKIIKCPIVKKEQTTLY